MMFARQPTAGGVPADTEELPGSPVDAMPLTSGGNDPAEMPPDGTSPGGVTASEIGSLLDADHLPMTNGRMAICRRCGAHTDGAEGRQHVPGVRQLARYSEWLCAQTRTRQMARASALRR
jgi:hypothetical protein